MRFIIFHGAFGDPQSNWFPELKEKLEALGQTVFAPQFPADDWNEITISGPQVKPKNQGLENWIETFEKNVLPQIKKNEKLCFIGHSLGPLFILHVVERFNIKLDSAIFVSPFLDKLNKNWQIDHVNDSFYKTSFNFEKLRKLIPVSYVLYSENDPYVDKNHSMLFAKALDSSLIFVKKAGHMNSEVNLNEFPLVLELCKTRLDLSLYQKYLEHRGKLYSMEFVKNKPQGIITLEPSEIIDEGNFHFKHLQHEGFCTFLTRLSSWDPEGRYYKDARIAAKRVKNFIRVFIVDNIEDLNRDLILKQIKLDLEADIKVYLCMLRDVENFLSEPDFGMWDKDYVCTVRFKENTGTMKEIELNSTKEMIENAQQWKKEILKRATEIHNIDQDIRNFIQTHSN